MIGKDFCPKDTWKGPRAPACSIYYAKACNTANIVKSEKCRAWARAFPDEAFDKMTSYCDEHPLDPECAMWADTSKRAKYIHKRQVRKYCTPFRLATEQGCQEACKKYRGNCNDSVLKYCDKNYHPTFKFKHIPTYRKKMQQAFNDWQAFAVQYGKSPNPNLRQLVAVKYQTYQKAVDEYRKASRYNTDLLKKVRDSKEISKEKDKFCACVNSEVGKYNPECIDKQCIMYGYKTTEALSDCPDIIDCGVYFDILHTGGNVDFNDLNIKQRCGGGNNEVERPSPDETSKGGDTGVWTDQKKLLTIILVVSGCLIGGYVFLRALRVRRE